MKRTNKNAIVIMLLFAMIIQMIIPSMGKAYADDDLMAISGEEDGGVTSPGAIGTVTSPGAITADPNAIKNVSLSLVFKDKDNLEIARYENGNLVPAGAVIPLDAIVEFSFGLEINDIDYDNEPIGIVDTEKIYEFKIADQIKISDNTIIPIFFPESTIQVATAIIKKDGIMTLQFLDAINTEKDEDRFVWVKSTGKIDESKLDLGGDKELIFEVPGGTIGIPVSFPETVPEEIVTLNKTGAWDGNRIKWEITVGAETVPSGGKVKNVIIKDILTSTNHEFSDHVYTGATYDDLNKTYTFDEIKDGETKKIVIYTIPDLSEIGPNEQGKDIEFKNEVSGTYGDDKEPLTPVNAVVTKKISFLEKSNGTFRAGAEREDNVVEWTVTINKSKLAMPVNTKLEDIIPSGLELVGDVNLYKENGKTKFTDAKVTSSANKIDIIFENGLSEVVIVKYNTKITDKDAYNPNKVSEYENEAILSWEDKDGETIYTVSKVGTVKISKTIIGKSATGVDVTDNKYVKWKITINKDKMDIENPVVVDTLPKELEYVSHSANPDIWGEKVLGINKNGEQTITFSYTGKINTAYTIDIVTRVKDEYKDIYGNNSTKTFTNKVSVSAKDLTAKSASANQNYVSKVIEKTAVDYDYTARTASWKIVVNQNNMTIKNTFVTDIIGEYHEFAEGSLYLEDTALTMVDGEPEVNEYSLTGKTIKINLGTITSKKTITYKTKIEEDEFVKIFGKNQVVELKNSATIFGDEIKAGGVTVTSSKSINSVLVNKGAKYTPKNDYIDWEVKINQNSIDLGKDVVLEDILQEGILLDKQTVKLYNLIVNSDNSTSTGDEVLNKLTVDYDTASRKVLFNLGEVKTPYILKFRTDIDADSLNATIYNTINLKGYGNISDDSAASVSVSFDNNSAGSGGGMTRGSIKVIKNDEAGSPIAGVKFEILNINKKSLNPKRVNITDDSGEALFDNLPMATYYIRELETLEEYKLPEFGNEPQIILKKGFDENGNELKYQDIILINEKKKGYVEFEKQDMEGNKLAGAIFELYSETDLSFGYVRASSGADGKVVFSNIPYGEYKIKEIKAPAGYIPSAEELSVSITKDGAKAIPNKSVVKNERIKGDLSVTKLDEDGTTPLAGAIFELVQNGVVKYESYETGSNGITVFKDLEHGEYVLREKKAPKNYRLSTEEIKISIEDKGQLISIEFKNEKMKGSFELTKIDEDTKGPLSGAEISLYRANAEDRLKDGTLIATGTTDVNGKLIFDKLPIGEYYYQETKAPLGYKNQSDTRYYFEIAEDLEVVKRDLTNKEIVFTGPDSDSTLDPKDIPNPEETPDLEEGETEIEEELVPGGSAEIEIKDELIPGGSAELPKTGEESPMLLYVLGFMFITSGIILLFKRRKPEDN